MSTAFFGTVSAASAQGTQWCGLARSGSSCYECAIGYKWRTDSPANGCCKDACPVQGAKQCMGGEGGTSTAFQVCWDSNGDGCLEWSGTTSCAPGSSCYSGDCLYPCDSYYGGEGGSDGCYPACQGDHQRAVSGGDSFCQAVYGAGAGGDENYCCAYTYCTPGQGTPNAGGTECASFEGPAPSGYAHYSDGDPYCLTNEVGECYGCQGGFTWTGSQCCVLPFSACTDNSDCCGYTGQVGDVLCLGNAGSRTCQDTGNPCSPLCWNNYCVTGGQACCSTTVGNPPIPTSYPEPVIVY